MFLVTCQVVLHELDGLKKGGSDRARASRDASRFLEDLAGRDRASLRLARCTQPLLLAYFRISGVAARDRASLRLARCAQASDRIPPLLSGYQQCHPHRAQSPVRPAGAPCRRPNR